MPQRKALFLQFFEGDKAAAMRNARRIADNEPTFRSDVDFVFSARFDCSHDLETINHVSKKFRVLQFTTTRKETGHPGGCNAAWCDGVNNFILGKYLRGEWTEVRWVLTFEADCIPVHPDWINKLDAEWDKATAQGKCVVGCWMPAGDPLLGHVNGNMMISPDLAKKCPGILGCPAGHAWDMFFAPIFHPIWMKTGLIANFYKDVKVSDDKMQRLFAGSKEPAVLIHGVKDDSAERYAAKHLRK